MRRDLCVLAAHTYTHTQKNNITFTHIYIDIYIYLHLFPAILQRIFHFYVSCFICENSTHKYIHTPTEVCIYVCVHSKALSQRLNVFKKKCVNSLPHHWKPQRQLPLLTTASTSVRMSNVNYVYSAHVSVLPLTSRQCDLHK